MDTTCTMSSSETSSYTSESDSDLSDDSSTWWDMGATIGVAAAVAATRSSGCAVKDARLPLQELTGRQWVDVNLADSKKCYKNFRLHPPAFHALHSTLVANHGLKSTMQCDSIEALGMFLWSCGTRQSQRQIADRFGLSTDTVCRKFGEVLEAMVSFADTIIRPRDSSFRMVHPRLLRFSPFFDGCIGAIDGTHIPVSVVEQAHDDFINRKGFTSQNVLAVCDMDMRFTFVATGKKGATHDMAVFREAVDTAEHSPHPPPGKYYLVDSGYTLREGYMAPYRKARYHLKEFDAKGHESVSEVFNYHHSCLRNIVERSFGVLKNKWQILKGIPFYSMEKQSKIIVACFALHNFALDNNEPDMDMDEMFGQGTYLERVGEQNIKMSDWLELTSNDDIATVRDWIATALTLAMR
ncbi:hypothetical protein U9M48_000341 [Paspalum notatum var. saurae]|uniref:DDE Tnp4 domain-containing protein n=1 Tax=Paspalum notatum var. saurae TaxID=547442 RepID=A0AAQ3PGV6_PASNO